MNLQLEMPSRRAPNMSMNRTGTGELGAFIYGCFPHR